MLTRVVSRMALALATAATGLIVAQAPARADYVYCPPLGGDCIVIVTGPGGPGDPGGPGSPGGGGGGGNAECHAPSGDKVPCHIDGLGWFNPQDGCYWQLANPRPPAGDPDWQGHQPGDGAVYTQACGWPGLVVFLNRWRATPPPGFGGAGPTPEMLAAEAIKRLGLRGPSIGVAPDESGAGLVGLPVWLWTAVTPQTWGPISATASVPGLAVTARARAVQIVWDMGDGSNERCNNPGTPYAASYGDRPSPTCGHRYTQSSRTRPGGRYTITATTTWDVDWWVVGGGATGSLTVTRQSTTSIRIDELQVVTR